MIDPNVTYRVLMINSLRSQVPLTHFLAGSRRHADYSYQPFVGGTKFVCLQMTGQNVD